LALLIASLVVLGSCGGAGSSSERDAAQETTLTAQPTSSPSSTEPVPLSSTSTTATDTSLDVDPLRSPWPPTAESTEWDTNDTGGVAFMELAAASDGSMVALFEGGSIERRARALLSPNGSNWQAETLPDAAAGTRLPWADWIVVDGPTVEIGGRSAADDHVNGTQFAGYVRWTFSDGAWTVTKRSDPGVDDEASFVMGNDGRLAWGHDGSKRAAIWVREDAEWVEATDGAAGFDVEGWIVDVVRIGDRIVAISNESEGPVSWSSRDLVTGERRNVGPDGLQADDAVVRPDGRIIVSGTVRGRPATVIGDGDQWV